MNDTYTRKFQTIDGEVFAEELKAHLDLGDKLIALTVDSTIQIAIGIFEQSSQNLTP